MKLAGLVSFWIGVLWAAMAVAGPFGVTIGDPIGNYEVSEPGPRPPLSSVPQPHPDFPTYAVWHSEATGICRIMAISKPFENDRYGHGIRSWMDGIRSALNGKYGASDDFGFLRPGALWKEPQDWVMAVRQNERQHGFAWKDATAGEDEDFALIQFWVEATSSRESFAILEYRGRNFDACVAAIQAEENSAF